VFNRKLITAYVASTLPEFGVAFRLPYSARVTLNISLFCFIYCIASLEVAKKEEFGATIVMLHIAM
jgi:hypothetical protein